MTPGGRRWSRRARASVRYSRLSRISAKTLIGKMIRISQAPSVNFTTAKITTTIEVSTPAEKLMTSLCRQPGPWCVWWYFAMPNPAMVNAVNTPIA